MKAWVTSTWVLIRTENDSRIKREFYLRKREAAAECFNREFRGSSPA